ncbi:MAG TPA: ANTAR domain-containing protein, partial [Streptosporangiaceae bacterium]
MTERAGDRATALSQRVLRAQARLEELMQVLAGSIARLQATRQDIQAGRSQRAVLHDSAYARLEARLASLPVIEQAKGIVMAQTGCGPEEAFDLLRKASQRGNVRCASWPWPSSPGPGTAIPGRSATIAAA